MRAVATKKWTCSPASLLARRFNALALAASQAFEDRGIWWCRTYGGFPMKRVGPSHRPRSASR
jgi:hypothetical protein